MLPPGLRGQTAQFLYFEVQCTIQTRAWSHRARYLRYLSPSERSRMPVMIDGS